MRYICWVLLLSSCFSAQDRPQFIKRILFRGAAVHDARFTADGKHFATIDRYGEVRVRRSTSGQCIQSVEDRRSKERQRLQQLVVDVDLGAFGIGRHKIYRIHDAKLVSWGAFEGYAEVRAKIKAQYGDLPEAKLKRDAAVRAQFQGLDRIVASPTGDAAVLFLAGDRALFWRKGVTTPIDDHPRWPYGITFSADGQYLAFRAGDELQSHDLHGSSAHALHLRDRRALIASGKTASEFILADRTGIRTYKGESGEVIADLPLSNIAQAAALKFGSFISCSASGNKLICRLTQGLAMIDLVAAKAWRLPDTDRVGQVSEWIWHGEEKAIGIIGYVGAGPGPTYEWAVATFSGPRLQKFSSFEASCGDVACYLPVRNQIVGGGSVNGGRSISVIDLASHKTVACFEREGWTLLSGLGEDRLLVVGMNEWAVLEMPTGKVLAEADSDAWIVDAAVSPDKRRFAIGTRAGQIDVYDLR